jgi:hypothetical protein
MADIRATLSQPYQIKSTVKGLENVQARTIAISSSSALARVQAGSVIVDTFTGDGVQSVFTLTKYAQSDEYVFVTVNGVSQHTSTFSVTGNVLTFSSAPFLGDDIEVRIINFSGSIVFNDALSTAAAGQVVDEFPKAEFRSAKYFIQMSHAGEYYISDFAVLHNDVDAFITEYGIMYTSVSLGDVSAIINGDLVQVIVTPTYSNTTISGQRMTLMT